MALSACYRCERPELNSETERIRRLIYSVLLTYLINRNDRCGIIHFHLSLFGIRTRFRAENLQTLCTHARSSVYIFTCVWICVYLCVCPSLCCTVNRLSNLHFRVVFGQNSGREGSEDLRQRWCKSQVAWPRNGFQLWQSFALGTAWSPRYAD